MVTQKDKKLNNHCNQQHNQQHNQHKRQPFSKSRDLERLWKNDVAPLEDPDLGVRVIPAHEREESLGKRPFTSGLCFSSRRAYWDESVGALVRDFAGRGTEASVKNFQIEASASAASHQAGVDVVVDDDDDDGQHQHQQRHQHQRRRRGAPSGPPAVQFGRASTDNNGQDYTLDVRFPFSVLQAMQLAISAIEDKVVVDR